MCGNLNDVCYSFGMFFFFNFLKADIAWYFAEYSFSVPFFLSLSKHLF